MRVYIHSMELHPCKDNAVKDARKKAEEQASSSSDAEARRMCWKKYESPGIFMKAKGVNKSEMKNTQPSEKANIKPMQNWWRSYLDKHGCQDDSAPKKKKQKKKHETKEKS